MAKLIQIAKKFGKSGFFTNFEAIQYINSKLYDNNCGANIYELRNTINQYYDISKGINSFETALKLAKNLGATQNFSNIEEVDQYLLENWELPDYLTFTALSDTATISLVQHKGTSNPNLEYSTDNGINWTNWKNVSYSTITITQGQSIKFKGINASFNTSANRRKFVLTGTLDISGNIMSILDGQKNGKTNIVPDYCFIGLFYQCDANLYCNNLEFPAKELGIAAYDEMFASSNIITAPKKISFNNGAKWCCYWLFSKCSKLTSIPNISFNSIGEQGLLNAFEQCTSLVDANVTIKGSNVGKQALAQMFVNCSNLITAPNIEITNVGVQGLYAAFYGCNKLETQNKLIINGNVDNQGLAFMYRECANIKSIDKVKLGDNLIDAYTFYCIFYNCIELNCFVEIPANLTKQCCFTAFKSTQIDKIRILAPASEINATNCESMFNDIKATGTCYCLDESAKNALINVGMPSTWTFKDINDNDIINNVPLLTMSTPIFTKTNKHSGSLPLNFELIN